MRTGEKSILEQLEEKAKEVVKKVEDALDEISADEEPLKVTYPDDEKPPEPAKK